MAELVAKSLVGSIPKEITALLGEPNLMRGESHADFNALLLSIANSVAARDIVVWSWCQDVTYQIWESRRFQRIRNGILLEAQVQVVEELLKSTHDAADSILARLYDIFDVKNEARKWAIDPDFAEKIDERLHLRGYSRSSVLAKAYVQSAPALAQIDQGIANLEARRMATLREISRHDAATARRLEEVSKVIEGEFTQAAE